MKRLAKKIVIIQNSDVGADFISAHKRGHIKCPPTFLIVLIFTLLFSIQDIPLVHSKEPTLSIKLSIEQKDIISSVEKKVEETVVAGIFGDMKTLGEGYKLLTEVDEALKEQNKPITGLGNNMLLFLISNNKDRDQRTEEQRKLLKGVSDPILRKTILSQLNQDELNEAKRLLRKDRKEKGAELINKFSENVGIYYLNEYDLWLYVFNIGGGGISALTRLGKFVGGLSKAIHRDITDISPLERKALVRYETFIKKYPNSKYVEEAKEKLEKLKRKKDKHDHKREMKLAKDWLKAGAYKEAIFRYEQALKIFPDSKKAKKGLKKARKKEEARRNFVHPTLMVEKNPSEEGYEDLLYAVVLMDPKKIISKGENYLKEGGELADEAKFALALAYEREGKFDMAQDLLIRLANDKDETNMERYANYLLESHEMGNPNTALKKIKRQYIKDSIQYLLFGGKLNLNKSMLTNSEGRNRLLQMAQMIGQRVSKNKIENRSLDFLFGSRPISRIAYLSDKKKLVDKEMEEERLREIYRMIGETYEKDENYVGALLYYLLSNKSEGKAKELEEKVANQILQLAERASTQFMKDFCHYAILSQYSHTRVAEKLEKAKRLKEIEANKSQNPLMGLSPHLVLSSSVNENAAATRIFGNLILREGSLIRKQDLSMNYSLLKGGQIISSTLSSNKTASYLWTRLSTGFIPTLSFNPPLLEKHFPVTGTLTIQPGSIGILPRIKSKAEEEPDYWLYAD